MADSGANGVIPSVESSPPISFDGMIMRFYYTPSYPDDSPYKRYTETTYDPSVPGSKPLSVPAHWHTKHDEYLSVTEGELDCWVGHGADRKHIVLTPGSGAAFAPRRTLHELKGREGVRTVVREGTSFGNVRTKESFFRNVLTAQNMWVAVGAASDGDAYMACPIMGYRSEQLEIAIVWLMGTFASLAVLFNLVSPPPELPDEKAYMQKAR